MGEWSATTRAFADAVGHLAFANPFLPARIDAEREALGDEFDATEAEWNLYAGEDTPRASAHNLEKIAARAAKLVKGVREHYDSKALPADAHDAYRDLVLFHLYHDHRDRFIGELKSAGQGKRVGLYSEFRRDFTYFFDVPGLPPADAAHYFAVFFNLRRAFHQIFDHLVGTSPAMSQLRAAIWQSIFTHNLRRYERGLHEHMADITTLITGPSGTGKELVARAIGLSRFVPFDDASESFSIPFADTFYPLNLSALSSTLIESELFGHKRGSFTGANEDHTGWLEVCGPVGTVFLDEIGETDEGIQVKLLRVLQSRQFQRLGDTTSRAFEGKVIAATNRDLAAEMQQGNFREDLYYRLCSDRIETPPLRDQIAGKPDELANLVEFIARREVGEEADALTEETIEVIDTTLGPEYPWPGNFRELEQCVRNVLVRRSYRPAVSASPTGGHRFLEALRAGQLTAEETMRGYCTIVYAQTHNYEQTARRLGIDRRTVKAKIDADLLAELDGRPADDSDTAGTNTDG